MIVTGYQRGRAFSLLVVEVAGIGDRVVLVESATATAFRAMRFRAAKEGIRLDIVSAWRSMDEQTAIWSERQDPHVRALKGVAARPGYSNHQSGVALDLAVGMTLASLRAGKKSPTFLWLEKHAGEFGFCRTVPSEPWHWEFAGVREDRP